MWSLWSSRVAFHLFIRSSVACFISVAAFACCHTCRMAWWAYTITRYVCFVNHCCGYPASCILHSSLSCAFITVGTVHVHNVASIQLSHCAVENISRHPDWLISHNKWSVFAWRLAWLLGSILLHSILVALAMLQHSEVPTSYYCSLTDVTCVALLGTTSVWPTLRNINL